MLRSMNKDMTQISPRLINRGREIQLPIDRCLKRRMPRLFTSQHFSKVNKLYFDSKRSDF
jgi:hypothetical protein